MPLDDADIADVLGGFLDKLRREMRRDLEALALESRTALAELRAEAAELHAQLRERMAHVALLKDGAPGAAGRDGLDGPQGPPGERGERGEAGEAVMGPPGEQGIQGPPGAAGSDGRNGADGIDGRDGEPGADGRDGTDGAGIADAFVGRDGELVVTFTDGRVKNLGAGFAKDINADALARMVSEAAADMWKGIWEPRTYKRGDWITHGGSLFVAVRDTAPEDRPSPDSEAWKIALRRGRDGKDAVLSKPPRPSLALPE